MVLRAILFHLAIVVSAIMAIDIPLISGLAHAENANNAENPNNADPGAPSDSLFAALHDPGEAWRIAEAEILQAWSRSGSAAMDLLLRRGIGALDRGEVELAIDHLTALTDHAPDFAEGWAARAAAFAAAGLYGPASADIARALQLEPRHFTALTLLCQILGDMNDASRAEAACRASLAIHPHQQEAIDLLNHLQHRRDGVLL